LLQKAKIQKNTKKILPGNIIISPDIHVFNWINNGKFTQPTTLMPHVTIPKKTGYKTRAYKLQHKKCNIPSQL